MKKLVILLAMAFFMLGLQSPTTILSDAKTSGSVTLEDTSKFLNNITIVGTAHAADCTMSLSNCTCAESVKQACSYGGDWVRAFDTKGNCKNECGKERGSGNNRKYGWEWANCNHEKHCKNRCNKFC